MDERCTSRAPPSRGERSTDGERQSGNNSFSSFTDIPHFTPLFHLTRSVGIPGCVRVVLIVVCSSSSWTATRTLHRRQRRLGRPATPSVRFCGGSEGGGGRWSRGFGGRLGLEISPSAAWTRVVRSNERRDRTNTTNVESRPITLTSSIISTPVASLEAPLTPRSNNDSSLAKGPAVVAGRVCAPIRAVRRQCAEVGVICVR